MRSNYYRTTGGSAASGNESEPICRRFRWRKQFDAEKITTTRLDSITIKIRIGDSATSDNEHLRITFHHNYYQNVVQRAPRVRYGQII
ncbi:pectate lyase family protein [Paenibacillus sp. Soil750]|uniref:pectate lyase family protein n=1 Tax=Paenibacillus sp. Soil750 TaxID=1736398 RepID=UPI002E12191D